MKIKQAAAVAGFFSAALIGVVIASGAAAKATPNTDTSVSCPGVTGWYVNPDETDRKPEPTENGFKFNASDLIHHAVNLPLGDLESGSYVAGPNPDQPSFFSVEIRDANGAYGTLRWNGTAWVLTTNLDTFTETDPAEFVGVATKWGEITEDTKVVSFGVGYTANPPGTVETVVSSVSFGDKTYSLKCKTEETPTANPTTNPPTHKPTKAPTKKPVATLPVTGAGGGTNVPLLLGGIAAVIISAGVLIMRFVRP